MDNGDPAKRGSRLKRIVVASLVVVAIVVASIAISTATSHADEGTVVKVIDGDTVDVEIDGVTERVRLLNVDAPEDNKVTNVTECLGVEATAELGRLLPKGAAVKLEYDDERRDRYGRLLAGVFDSDGTLVNAEMARVGLAGPLVIGGNDRFETDVVAAFEAARADGVGAYDKQVACAVGAIVAAYESEATQMIEAVKPEDAAGLSDTLVSMESTSTSGDTTVEAIEAAAWIGDAEIARLVGVTREMKSALGVARNQVETAHKNAVAEEARIAEEARVAEEARLAEESRRAAEQAARDQQARDAAAREQSRIETNPRQSTPAQPAQPAPPARDDGGGSQYTGCRNYNGTGMIDTKGRPFAPIPCP